MKDIVQLKHFEANSFMGISHEDPIVIEFVKNKKAKVLKLTGDQGTGKTSTITAFMYLMGAAFNIDAKTFKNINDEAIDLKLEFEHDGGQYKIEASGNRITLKRFYKESDKWVTENSPKETIRKIFGNLGISPLFLKELSGKKQIQWFKETFGTDEEATKKEQKLVLNIDTVFNQRRDVNRDIKNLKGALETEPLYQNYEKSQEKFKAAPSAKKEKDELDAITTKNSEYDKAKTGIDGLRQAETRHKAAIKEYEGKLAVEKEALKLAEKRITDGLKYVEDNKDVPEKYAAANEAWLNLSKTLAEHERWKGILKKEKEYIEMQEASTQADGTLDKLRVDLLKLTKTYLPPIDGLTLKVKTGLDDEEEGIYYNEKTLAQLSESELWALFMQIWEQKDVSFVFCENINALGSDAISILNKLVKEGAQVFATEMVRKQKEMEFSLETKVE